MIKALLFAIFTAWPCGAQTEVMSPQQVEEQLNKDLHGRVYLLDIEPKRLPPPPSLPALSITAANLRHKIPKEAMKSFKLALKHSQKRDFDKAAAELEKAVARDPEFAAAHGNLGLAYTHLGRLPEAEAELRRAIALAPGESVNYSNLAVVQYLTGNVSAGEESATEALRLSPDNPAAHLFLGVVQAKRPESRAEAIRHLEEAARVIPLAKELLRKMK